jgi:ubiquinone biosynthesis protein COQ9
MTDAEFDLSLVTAAFALGAESGWRKVSPGAAARRAGLDLVQARGRFASRGAILRKFGELADQHALTGALAEGPVRDRLFDILLRRFDFLQTHRAGVVALLKTLPLEPELGVCLARATVRSMGWVLEGAGISAGGVFGEIRKRGLAVVWAFGVQAWLRDESADLSVTMAAVDKALSRADALAARFHPKPATPADVPFDPVADPNLPFPEEPSEVV